MLCRDCGKPLEHTFMLGGINPYYEYHVPAVVCRTPNCLLRGGVYRETQYESLPEKRLEAMRLVNRKWNARVQSIRKSLEEAKP